MRIGGNGGCGCLAALERKKGIRKRPKEGTQLPKGTAVSLFHLRSPSYTPLLSFSLSIILFFFLSVTSTCKPLQFLATAHYSLHQLAPLSSVHLSIPLSLGCVYIIPHSRAKLTGTLEECVRDQTLKFSRYVCEARARMRTCSDTIIVVQINFGPVSFDVAERMERDIGNRGK